MYIAALLMKTSYFNPLVAAAVAAFSLLTPLSGCSRQPAAVAGSSLPEPTRGLLERYEKVRAALAADKFDDARFQAGELANETKAAAARPDAAEPIKTMATASATMAAQTRADRLREEFKPVSVAAIKLASGAPGFYVINCPMTKDGDWLQTDAKVSNPYYGKSMLECGVVKK